MSYTFTEDQPELTSDETDGNGKELIVEYSEEDGKGSLVYKDADGNVIEEREGTPEELGIVDEGVTIGEFDVEFDGNSISGGIAQEDTAKDITAKDIADFMESGVIFRSVNDESVTYDFYYEGAVAYSSSEKHGLTKDELIEKYGEDYLNDYVEVDPKEIEPVIAELSDHIASDESFKDSEFAKSVKDHIKTK